MAICTLVSKTTIMLKLLVEIVVTAGLTNLMVHSAAMDDIAIASGTPVTPAPIPVPATTPAPVPASTASGADTVDMYDPATQKFVDKVLEFEHVCTSQAQSKLFSGYTHNKQLYDQCVQDTEYAFFPNKGILPTQPQIQAFVDSKGCMILLTGIAKSFYPECNVYNFSGRSGAEISLRIRHQVLIEKKPLPTPQQYHLQYRYNQAVNLLLENDEVRQKVYTTVPNADVAFPLDKLVKTRSPLFYFPGVSIASDMTITVNDGGSAGSSSSVTNDSRTDVLSDSKNPNINAFDGSPANSVHWISSCSVLASVLSTLLVVSGAW